ncbi:MAG: P-loop NTPase [Deltaproteobacteria bacterium]|nr:P-loop NTPase [Deltaproteobacteria bacterium]
MRIFRELELDETTDSSIQEENRAYPNLAAVRAIIACGSARGGVGKSALLVNIAAALALAGRKIGIVDADLNSPSIAAMLGVKVGRRAFVTDEIEPVTGPLGLRIVSSEFLPEGEPLVSFADLDENTTVAQNGVRPCEFGYLATMRRLLGQSRFGPLDLVLVDLASGVEHIYQLFKIVPRAKLLLVSHPSELSARAMRAAIGIASQHPDAVIGVVENMAGFNCDGCHRVRPLMPYGAVGAHAREAGASLLERLPFDPRFAETCDRGVIFVREYPQTPLAKQIAALVQIIDKAGEPRPQVQGAISS